MYSYFCGLDLGQVNDYSAWALIEEPLWVDTPPELGPHPPPVALNELPIWQGGHRGWTSPAELLPAQHAFFLRRNQAGLRPEGRPPLRVRDLRRWPLGTSYASIVEDVRAMLGRPPLSEVPTVLLVDHGGVGRGVFDIMWQRGLAPIGVTLTAGEMVNVESETQLKVPKRWLVGSAQIAIQEHRLRIAPGLKEAATLTRELADYRVRISPGGHDLFEARQGANDDLVIAVGMAVFYRDWFCQHMDDHIAEVRRHGAREALA